MRLFDNVVRLCPTMLGAFVVDVQEPFNLWDASGEILTCAPPWEEFFLEATFTDRKPEVRMGLFVSAFRLEVDGRRIEECHLRGDGAYFPEFEERFNTSIPRGWLHPDAHWLLDCSLFVEAAGVAWEQAVSYVQVRADGRPCSADGNLKCITARSVTGPGATAAAVGALNIDSLQKVVWRFLWSVQFLHCKNITLREVVPSQPRVMVTGRKHGAPKKLVRYHVLDIEPMRRVLRGEGGMGERGEGVKQALHVCRGHFKDYRQRGLFGKRKGLFWWDQHARGDVKVGIVEKDYAVKAGGA